MNHHVLLSVCTIATSLGCATVRSGSFDINEDYADVDFPKIKSRAAFDLNCPSDQLVLVTLDATNVISSGQRATQVGVRGCGHRAVYVRRGQEWVMNSAVTK